MNTENEELHNTPSSNTVGTERLQEKAGTTKAKPDGHHPTRSEGYGHYLERSQRTDDRQK